MKILTVLASMLLISGLSFGSSVDENSTWEEIQASYSHKAEFPMVSLGSTFFSYDRFCQDGDALRGGSYERCTRRETNERGDCIEWETIAVDLPINYSETVCVERETNERGDCIRWETVERTRPLNLDVDVCRVNGGRAGCVYDFTKEYQVPACQ